MNIDDIRHRVLSGHYLISFTHTEKLRRRKISLTTIEDAIRTGSIIEDYPKDPEAPHASFMASHRKDGLFMWCASESTAKRY
jgi:hypothetical protein